MRVYERGYILPLLIFIIAFLSSAFSISLYVISYNLKSVNRSLKLTGNIKSYYSTLGEILKYFTDEINETFTSPYDGWFKYLPSDIDGFKIEYSIEDAKIDINHIDLRELKENKFIKTEKLPKYFYYSEEVKPYIKDEFSKEYSEIFTIYNLPNLNLCDIDKLKLFLESSRFDLSLQKEIAERLKSYRGGNTYLSYNGLIIDEAKYTNFRTLFPRAKEDDLYIFFDYRGQININIVSEEVFEIGVKLCSPDKNLDYKKYFDIIKRKREQETSIRDLKEIFGNQTGYFEKIFSVDSSIFLISLTKEGKELKCLLRRYKNFRGENKIHILKYFFKEDLKEDNKIEG